MCMQPPPPRSTTFFCTRELNWPRADGSADLSNLAAAAGPLSAARPVRCGRRKLTAGPGPVAMRRHWPGKVAVVVIHSRLPRHTRHCDSQHWTVPRRPPLSGPTGRCASAGQAPVAYRGLETPVARSSRGHALAGASPPGASPRIGGRPGPGQRRHDRSVCAGQAQLPAIAGRSRSTALRPCPTPVT
jgi:hypothetical protein